MQEHWELCLIWTNKPLQPYFDATEDRQRTSRGSVRFEQGCIGTGRVSI